MTRPAIPEERLVFSTRLREAVWKSGGPKIAAEAAGIPLSTLNTYLSGAAEPRVTVAQHLAQTYRTTIGYLLGSENWDGEPYKARILEVRSQISDPDVDYEDAALVPRLSVRLSAGIGRANEHAADFEKVAVSRALLRRLNVSEHNAHLVRIDGDSMEDEILDRDEVLIDTAVEEPLPEGIYAVVSGELGMLKRLQPIASMGLIRVLSDNPRYETQTVKMDDASFRIVGRAKLVMREL